MPETVRLKTALVCILLITMAFATIAVLHSSPSQPPEIIGILKAPLISGFSAVIGASLVVLIFDLFIRRSLVEADKDSLKKITTETLQQTLKASQNLGELGVNAVHRKMQNREFVDSCKGSSEILMLNTFIPNIRELREGIIDVLERGGTVRALVSHPENLFVDVRWPELHDSKDVFVSGIADTITKLRDYFEQSGSSGRVIVKQYKRGPGVSIYATNDKAWVGSYLSKLDSMSTPFMELQSSSRVWSEYQRHFETIWGDIDEPFWDSQKTEDASQA